MEAGSQDGDHPWLGREANRVVLIKGCKVSILQVDKVGDGLHNSEKVFKTTEPYA